MGVVILRDMSYADIPQVSFIDREAYGDLAWQPESFGDELSRAALTEPMCHYVVAEQDGQVIAFAGLRLVPTLQLQTLAVAQSHRRQGIGRSLLNYMVARANGQSMTLLVRPDNVAARELYSSTGFTLTGTLPDYYGTMPAHHMTRCN